MATQPRLKLLIDSRMKRVVFAEAGKDFVDFLFSLLAMPVGSIIKLITEEKMVGSMGSVYKSVESLDDTYMQSNHSKSMLLNHTTAKNDALSLIEGSSTPTAIKYYRCGHTCSCSGCYYTNVSGTKCPYCNRNMVTEMACVSPQSGAVSANAATGESAGFVKGMVTYTVMGDLSVMPTSGILSITMLNKFNIKDVSSLEERTVKLGMEEGLELLRVSLQSKTVLTDVFLGKTTTTTMKCED